MIQCTSVQYSALEGIPKSPWQSIKIFSIVGARIPVLMSGLWPTARLGTKSSWRAAFAHAQSVRCIAASMFPLILLQVKLEQDLAAERAAHYDTLTQMAVKQAAYSQERQRVDKLLERRLEDIADLEAQLKRSQKRVDWLETELRAIQVSSYWRMQPAHCECTCLIVCTSDGDRCGDQSTLVCPSAGPARKILHRRSSELTIKFGCYVQRVSLRALDRSITSPKDSIESTGWSPLRHIVSDTCMAALHAALLHDPAMHFIQRRCMMP